MRLFLTVRIFIALLLLCVAQPREASAAVVTITTNQALSFGTFAMGTFASVATITIHDNGTFTNSGGIVTIANPTIGEYTLDAGVGEAGTVYTVTAPASMNLTGPDATLLIDNFSITPALLQFEPDGTDDISVGARLNTPGDGNGFNGGSYTGTLSLNVAF